MAGLSTKAEALAVAIAVGKTVRKHCLETGIPERSAYRWASEEPFKQRVASLRIELTDRCLGRLSRHAAAAVVCLARVVRDPEAEDADRIRAARAILTHHMAYRINVEMYEVLKRIDKSTAATAPLPKLKPPRPKKAGLK